MPGGRLDTAKRALELLNASNRREAVTLAADLKELNDSRKEMTEEGVEEAVRQIESSSWKGRPGAGRVSSKVSRKYRRNYCGEDQGTLLSSDLCTDKGRDRSERFRTVDRSL